MVLLFSNRISRAPFYSFLLFTSLLYAFLLIFKSFSKTYFSAFFAFATPLLTKSCLISFPFVTEMFHFTKFWYLRLISLLINTVLFRELCSSFVFYLITPSKFFSYFLYALCFIFTNCIHLKLSFYKFFLPYCYSFYHICLFIGLFPIFYYNLVI